MLPFPASVSRSCQQVMGDLHDYTFVHHGASCHAIMASRTIRGQAKFSSAVEGDSLLISY